MVLSFWSAAKNLRVGHTTHPLRMSMEKAAIDRIDEGIVVLLVGPEERELSVLVGQLPPGVQAGDWLRVIIVNGKLKQVELDREEAQKRRERIKAKLNRLFNKNS